MFCIDLTSSGVLFNYSKRVTRERGKPLFRVVAVTFVQITNLEDVVFYSEVKGEVRDTVSEYASREELIIYRQGSFVTP